MSDEKSQENMLHLMRPEKFKSRDYTQGYLDCLYDFAHWKDGRMYVGSCGKTYGEVATQIKQYNEVENI